MAANNPPLPRVRCRKYRGVNREKDVVALAAAVRVAVLAAVVGPAVAVVHLYDVALPAHAETNAVFVQYFPAVVCLSRACLGKQSLSEEQAPPKRRFCTDRRCSSSRDARRRCETSRNRPFCEINAHLFFELSLCFSRACLVKMIIFSIKRRKRYAFSAPREDALGLDAVEVVFALARPPSSHMRVRNKPLWFRFEPETQQQSDARHKQLDQSKHLPSSRGVSGNARATARGDAGTAV